MQGWAMSSALLGCLLGSIKSSRQSLQCIPIGTAKRNVQSFSAITFSFISASWHTRQPTKPLHHTGFIIFISTYLAGVGTSGTCLYTLSPNVYSCNIIACCNAQGNIQYPLKSNLTIVIGILTAQLVNWQIAEPVPIGSKDIDILASWNGQIGWRWMFRAELVPACK